MAGIYRTRASLRIFGDDLDPEAVSALLRASPTSSAKMGEIWVSRRGARLAARTGRWLLEAVQSGDLDRQLVALLSRLTSDFAAWRTLVSRFKADIFCGLFLQESNEGLELHPETLAMIGARGLSLGFDIYAPPREEGDEPTGETM